MSDLASQKCIPCSGKTPPLDRDRVEELLQQLDSWDAHGVHHLEKSYRFPDFARALKFVNAIGAVAEEENHHPDITFTWGMVRVEIRTHAIDGLSESDFILAAKIDRLPPD